MTIETRDSTVPVEKKQIPARAVVARLVLAVLIAGGVIYLFVFGSTPRTRTVTVDPAKTTPGNRPRVRMANRPPRPTRGVSKMRDGEWRVQGDNATMRVSQNGGAESFVFFYPSGLNLTPEQSALAAGRFRILHDEAMAKEWGVTPEQIARIKKVDLSVTMKIAAEDEAKLKSLWAEYEKAGAGAATTEAEKKLSDALTEAGKKAMGPTKDAFVAQLQQIQSALTAEQVAKLSKR